MYHTSYIVCLLLILILVEKEVFLRGIIWPNILYTVIDIAFVFNLLQILKDFKRST